MHARRSQRGLAARAASAARPAPGLARQLRESESNPGEPAGAAVVLLGYGSF